MECLSTPCQLCTRLCTSDCSKSGLVGAHDRITCPQFPCYKSFSLAYHLSSYFVSLFFYYPVITCNQVLLAPVNGAISVGPRTALSVLDFSCNQGFTLQGSRSTICQLDGTWSSGTPTCKRMEYKVSFPFTYQCQ